MAGGLSGISFVFGAGFGAVIALLIMILKRLKSIELKLSERGQSPSGHITEQDR